MTLLPIRNTSTPSQGQCACYSTAAQEPPSGTGAVPPPTGPLVGIKVLDLGQVRLGHDLGAATITVGMNAVFHHRTLGCWS
jgi:hypothetical protein